MNQPTEQPAEQQTVDTLIDEALGAARVLPPYDRCIALNRDLRAAIGNLYLAAEEQAGRYPERSRDWYRVHNVLDDTRTVLAEDLGSGLLSAALHLGALARQARALETETR